MLLGLWCRICAGQTGSCTAAGGVGSWIGDGSCDPQNLSSECGWDEGDCCESTCVSDDFVCGIDGYFCLNPSHEDEPPPFCSEYDNTTLVVEDAMDVKALAEKINCSSGIFNVEWRGSILINTEIAVSHGTVLSVTGVEPGAIIDGGGKTRLFRLLNASLHLNGMEIRNGSGTFGGAITAIGSTLILNRTSFVDNIATKKNGGAMFLYGSNVSFEGHTAFYNNSAYSGGSLFAVGSSNVSLEGVSSFRENVAAFSGGALGVVGGSTISWEAETTFAENYAAVHGGALFLENDSSASWSANAYFIANNAQYEGGAIFVDLGSNLSWTRGATFFGNSVKYAGGGAMFIADSSTVRLSGETSFKSNRCTSEGGAVSSRALDLSTSSSSGNPKSVLLITGPTIFAMNYCGSHGGALALLSGMSTSLESNNITFVGNEAGLAGGGVFLSTTGGGPVFSNASFFGNYAQIGGGVYVTGSGTSVNLSDDELASAFDECTFIDNEAESLGGAIELASGTATITNTVFKRNRAGSGGALRLAGITSLQGCTFEENLADVDGAPAVSMIGSTLEIEDCNFSGNTYACEAGTFINESGVRMTSVVLGCRCTLCNNETVV